MLTDAPDPTRTRRQVIRRPYTSWRRCCRIASGRSQGPTITCFGSWRCVFGWSQPPHLALARRWRQLIDARPRPIVRPDQAERSKHQNEVEQLRWNYAELKRTAELLS